MASLSYQYKKKYKKSEKGKKVIAKQKAKYYAKTSIYKGRFRYTEEEDKMILNHKLTDTELSKLIKHSVMSIQIRRNRLKNKEKENDEQ